MTHGTFEKLSAKYGESQIYKSTIGHGGSPPISPETSILFFLWLVFTLLTLQGTG